MSDRRAFLRSDDPRHHLALALDVGDRDAALRLVDTLGDDLVVVKVGLQLFTAYGPAIVGELRESGHEVFLDLKLHDIPNTMASAVRSMARLDVAFATVHAAAGPTALGACTGAAGGDGPAVLAVTVLTSLDDAELARVLGRGVAAREEVCRRGALAVDAGAHGLVASPQEVRALRERLGPGPLLVTPGIRPADADPGDQSRVATPIAAREAGADLLVVGRPIRDASRPREALRRILDEMQTRR